MRPGSGVAPSSALLLLMFISYTVSASPFMTAPLLLIIVNLSFLIANLSKREGHIPQINWPCADLVRSAASAVIFLIVSCTTAAHSRQGGLATAAVFGFLLTGVLIYDAYHAYRTLLSMQETPNQGQGESESNYTTSNIHHYIPQ
ncbi:CKLF-like MARVEL transmembrane domain-containing protein 5 [Hemiscyllium ocellatum]|uniref:CKLF-like MARVEL transmembrane domain-containing protein 5 n=1 Tax=Hemiscyllium ocellatum TaxID=170820 RepID=UPI002966F73D|nr:CKLF-like MARVEL transmembrane domain-containing protein 5 [Hemiscyllium ocellatum]